MHPSHQKEIDEAIAIIKNSLTSPEPRLSLRLRNPQIVDGEVVAKGFTRSQLKAIQEYLDSELERLNEFDQVAIALMRDDDFVLFGKF